MFRSFRFAFRILVKMRSSKLERNNMMAILLYMMELFPNMQIGNSGIVDDVCILCSASELGTGGTWASEIRISGDDDDYQFKKMLIIAIYYFIYFKKLMVINGNRNENVVYIVAFFRQ